MSDKKQIRDFLLGKIKPETADSFLADCFSTDEKAEEYESVRQNLIESYLDNKLLQSDRELFEKYFLDNPHHRELLEFSRILRRNLAADKRLAGLAVAESGKKSFNLGKLLIPAVAFGALILIGIFGFKAIFNQPEIDISSVKSPTPTTTKTPEIIAPNTSETPKTNQNSSETPQTNQNSSPASIGSPQPQPTNSQPVPTPQTRFNQNPVLAFFLPMGGKGGADEVLKLSKQNKSVELKTAEPFSEFPKYRVKIFSGESLVFNQPFDKFKVNAKKQITIAVSADIFSSGDYRFIIEGIKDDGSGEDLRGTESFFRVERLSK